MAVYRETPKCPYCNKPIAKAIHKKQNPYNPAYGDSFIMWNYKRHWCLKGVIVKRKMKKNRIDLSEIFKDKL